MRSRCGGNDKGWGHRCGGIPLWWLLLPQWKKPKVSWEKGRVWEVWERRGTMVFRRQESEKIVARGFTTTASSTEGAREVYGHEWQVGPLSVVRGSFWANSPAQVGAWGRRKAGLSKAGVLSRRLTKRKGSLGVSVLLDQGIQAKGRR